MFLEWAREERVLDERNEAHFADLVRLAASVRHKDGPKNHALWRMHPERWLESIGRSNIASARSAGCERITCTGKCQHFRRPIER